jgi:high-affinity K+ transport system ATPase subunit B
MNYTLIIIATLAQFILGGLWYSPLMFGKWWMEVMGVESCSKEEMQKMQKSMGAFYALQIFLTLVSTIVFAMFINSMPDYSPYMTALFVLVGFIIPTQIAGVIWGNTPKTVWSKQIFVMAAYQFVAIMITSFILSY